MTRVDSRRETQSEIGRSKNENTLADRAAAAAVTKNDGAITPLMRAMLEQEKNTNTVSKQC